MSNYSNPEKGHFIKSDITRVIKNNKQQIMALQKKFSLTVSAGISDAAKHWQQDIKLTFNINV